MIRSTILLNFLLAANLIAFDQDGAPVRRTPPKAAPKASIRVDVNMVLVPVSVTDTFGRSIVGLAANNFRIEDGASQVPIVSFGRQDQPITVGLIFDCSRSMRPKYENARLAPEELFRQLNPDDQSFLITISDRARLRSELTSDFAEMQNLLLFTHPDGMTPLVDGIYMGIQQIRKSHNPRKALVVVTDGGDNNSRYTVTELRRLALESDSQIFAAGLYYSPNSQEEKDGPILMQDLCDRTGGANFLVRNPQQLCEAMSKIGVLLHNQYLIGYYPPESGDIGKYRRIHVQLLLPAGLPQMFLHARAGYFVPE